MSRDVAIIDYGMGNLFSVAKALESVGLTPCITSDPAVVDGAAAVVLPGVGAFGTAMMRLRDQGLDKAILRAVEQGRQVMGICLGLQLLMQESQEFGLHQGLGVFKGTVRQLSESEVNGRREKVPHVGWKPLLGTEEAWTGSLMAGVTPGEWMYFVHSYVVEPAEERALCLVEHGTSRFCGALNRENVFACQFHPERSGPQGLALYANLASRLGVSAADASANRK